MLQQPKRDYRGWMLWILATAVVGLFSTLIAQDHLHRVEMKESATELTRCQSERTKAEAAFRAEISALYKEVQAYREEVFTQAMQYHKIKKK